MIEAFVNWLFQLFLEVFTALWDIITDLAVSIFGAVLDAIAGAIAAIPAPDFLSENSIGSLVNMLPDYVMYFVGAMKIGEGLAILGAGFAFRMLRKALTLGQW